MDDTLLFKPFPLLDLVSQGRVVEQLLWGYPHEQKIAWLAMRGKIERWSMPPDTSPSRFPVTYGFTSTVALHCAFFFWNQDKLVFLGDHHTFRPPAHDAW